MLHSPAYVLSLVDDDERGPRVDAVPQQIPRAFSFIDFAPARRDGSGLEAQDTSLAHGRRASLMPSLHLDALEIVQSALRCASPLPLPNARAAARCPSTNLINACVHSRVTVVHVENMVDQQDMGPFSHTMTMHLPKLALKSTVGLR